MLPLRDKEQCLSLLAEKGFSPDIVLDVGGAAGTEGLYTTWPNTRYVLIEPLAKFAPDLEVLCARLGNASYRIAAAGSAPDNLVLAHHPTEPHLVALDKDAPSDWPRDLVEMVTVDQIISEETQSRSIKSVLLKIDVDGPEIDVLNGSALTFEKATVIIIEAPLHDRKVGRFGQIVSYMYSKGYDCFDILEPVLRPRDQILWQVDLVFVSRKLQLRSDFGYYPEAKI
jgi:FkbM family methyltransferase